MKNKKRFILPALFLLSFTALVMKKFMLPFHGLLLIVVFDILAIVYFMRAFKSEKIEGEARGRSFNFDVSSIVYGICSIAILYRLQYWDGWEEWISVAGVLFLMVSILTFYATGVFFKLPEWKSKVNKLLYAHLSWLYFLILFTPVFFSNPRTFHNLFNGTPYETYVRTRYPVEEGTAMVELYKPTDAASLKSAEKYFNQAVQFEKNEEYGNALDYYNKSIDYNPDNATVIYNRGRLKLTKLEIDVEMAQSAFNDFSRALQLDSNMALAYYSRAVVHNYLYPRNRQPTRNDILMAKSLDSSLSNNKFVRDFLELPLVNRDVDTTSYIDLDKQE